MWSSEFKQYVYYFGMYVGMGWVGNEQVRFFMLFGKVSGQYVFNIFCVKYCIFNIVEVGIDFCICDGFWNFFNFNYLFVSLSYIQCNIVNIGVEVIDVFCVFQAGKFYYCIIKYFGLIGIGLKKRFGAYFEMDVVQFFFYIIFFGIGMYIEIVQEVIDFGVDVVVDCCDLRKVFYYGIYEWLIFFGFIFVEVEEYEDFILCGNVEYYLLYKVSVFLGIVESQALFQSNFFNIVVQVIGRVGLQLVFININDFIESVGMVEVQYISFIGDVRFDFFLGQLVFVGKGKFKFIVVKSGLFCCMDGQEFFDFYFFNLVKGIVYYFFFFLCLCFVVEVLLFVFFVQLEVFINWFCLVGGVGFDFLCCVYKYVFFFVFDEYIGYIVWCYFVCKNDFFFGIFVYCLAFISYVCKVDIGIYFWFFFFVYFFCFLE